MSTRCGACPTPVWRSPRAGRTYALTATVDTPLSGRKGPRARARGSGADQARGAHGLDRALESLPEFDLGLPAEHLAGERDVRLADLRVVGGQGLVHDLRARAGDLDHRVGQLEQRELVGIADVDGLVVARLGEPDDPVDEIADITERPGLRA